MFALLVSAALLGATGEAWPPDHVVEGSCEDTDGNCEELAYTSLLQETFTLHKKPEIVSGQHEQAHHKAIAEDSPAFVGIVGAFESSPLHHQLLLLSVVIGAGVVFGLLVNLFFIVPAQGHVLRRSSLPGSRGLYHSSLSAGEALIRNADCDEDMVDIRNEDCLGEDAYCLAIALVVRDLHALAVGNCNKTLRLSRVVWSMGLIFLTLVLQLSILVCTKSYVTPQQVAGIRGAYEEYEQAMYGDHTYLNQFHKHRGVAGFFNASAFDALDDDLKTDVCNIPLSQLGFLSLVLLVWAITCMSQLKHGVENFMAVVVFSTTVHSMGDALLESPDDSDDEGAKDECGIDDGVPVYVIHGCTTPVKVFLSMFVFLPDIAATCYVLWLGSRWLVATNDFGNVLSNAVALEFTLMLKVLIYKALASERNKRDLSHTALAPSWNEEPAGCGIYFSSTAWALFAGLWVYYYVYHQAVLADYKWDLSSVCTPWLQNQLSASGGE